MPGKCLNCSSFVWIYQSSGICLNTHNIRVLNPQERLFESNVTGVNATLLQVGPEYGCVHFEDAKP
jgi:hypothetical protein